MPGDSGQGKCPPERLPEDTLLHKRSATYRSICFLGSQGWVIWEGSRRFEIWVGFIRLIIISYDRRSRIRKLYANLELHWNQVLFFFFFFFFFFFLFLFLFLFFFFFFFFSLFLFLFNYLIALWKTEKCDGKFVEFK